jgi:hypothetical protein
MTPDIGYAETASVAPIRNLPENAMRVQYYLRGLFGPMTVYEFLTTEQEFKDWGPRSYYGF